MRRGSRIVSGAKVRLQQHVCSIGVWKAVAVLCFAVYGTPLRFRRVECHRWRHDQYGVSVRVRAATDAHAIAVSHVFGAWLHVFSAQGCWPCCVLPFMGDATGVICGWWWCKLYCERRKVFGVGAWKPSRVMVCLFE